MTYRLVVCDSLNQANHFVRTFMSYFGSEYFWLPMHMELRHDDDPHDRIKLRVVTNLQDAYRPAGQEFSEVVFHGQCIPQGARDYLCALVKLPKYADTKPIGGL